MIPVVVGVGKENIIAFRPLFRVLNNNTIITKIISTRVRPYCCNCNSRCISEAQQDARAHTKFKSCRSSIKHFVENYLDKCIKVKPSYLYEILVNVIEPYPLLFFYNR